MNVDLYSTLPLIIHVNLCMFLFIALSLSLSPLFHLIGTYYLRMTADDWFSLDHLAMQFIELCRGQDFGLDATVNMICIFILKQNSV